MMEEVDLEFIEKEALRLSQLLVGHGDVGYDIARFFDESLTPMIEELKRLRSEVSSWRVLAGVEK